MSKNSSESFGTFVLPMHATDFIPKLSGRVFILISIEHKKRQISGLNSVDDTPRILFISGLLGRSYGIQKSSSQCLCNSGGAPPRPGNRGTRSHHRDVKSSRLGVVARVRHCRRTQLLGIQMKTMTCKQLGGACEKEFHAETWEDMEAQSKAHGMEMFNDEAHRKAMQRMKELMGDPVAMREWFEEKQKTFEALPNN